ncbi:hypothetical protein MHU86_8360 [Fragilaria crotonensis]|nr:hypothetical protein MHU86_8360 [Fragilaria crotonensis]
MKGALQRSVHRVVSKRHDSKQVRRQLSSVSSSSSSSAYDVRTQAGLSTFPLAETGWEHPVETPQNGGVESLSEYNCSVEETLRSLFEINQLGKSEVSFQNLQLAVGAARHSKSLHACYLCGRTKFLNELCEHCALIPASAQR